MFETTIEKVIVGGYDNNGNANPHMLNFIFKSGVSNKDYIGKIDQSKIVKLTEFSCDYQHYVFEKTEKGGGRKLLVPQIKVIVSLNIWRPGKKLMNECKTIDFYLTPLSSEVSQMRISDKINEMEENGWRNTRT